MIEELLKRKPIRDFLTRYPKSQWKDIISNVFEIGVLNLGKSFKTYEFTPDEFAGILYDLRQNQPNFNRTQPKEYYETDYIERKPTYRDTYRTQYINDEIDRREERRRQRLSSSKGEVFIADMDEIKRNIHKNRPRYEYYPTPEQIYQKNNELKNNLQYAESVERANILRDKDIYRQQQEELKNRKLPEDKSPPPKDNMYDLMEEEEEDGDGGEEGQYYEEI